MNCEKSLELFQLLTRLSVNIYKRVQLLSDVHYILPFTTERNLHATHHPRYKDRKTKHITI
jgi:hypothetical protein